MRRQSPRNNQNQNWLYLVAIVVGTLTLGAIVFAAPNLSKSAQSQIAGTWKVETIALSIGSPSITIIISPDGKVTALNPQNEKEAIELAKITKISDVTTLPDSAKVQSDPFANQATKARLSEAKTYVSTLNKLQQAYFTEKDNWGQNINALGIGFNAPTDNYGYNTQVVSSIKTANIKNYPGISVQTGLAKKEGLKSYVGVVYLSNTSSNDLTTISLLCESNEPTFKASGLPKFEGNTMLCPDGYNPLK